MTFWELRLSRRHPEELIDQHVLAVRERDPWEEWHLGVRISAVQESIKRSRFALLVSIFAASASIICLWNMYFSWQRTFAFSAFANPPAQHLSLHDELLLAKVKSWVDSSSVTINLLGIHISVNDFAILNSSAQFFFIYYWLLSERRENREVGRLLRDSRVQVDLVRRAVLSAVDAYMVFNLNTDNDNAIGTLIQAPGEEPRKIFGVRPVFKIMMYLPLISILLTIFCDLTSLFGRGHFLNLVFGSSVRPGGLWGALTVPERIYALIADAIALGIASMVISLTIKIRIFQKATRAILTEFRQNLTLTEVAGS